MSYLCKRSSRRDWRISCPWICAPASAPSRGYVCVVSKMHAVEPYELSTEQSNPFWHDAITPQDRGRSGSTRKTQLGSKTKTRRLTRSKLLANSWVYTPSCVSKSFIILAEVF